MMNIKFKPAFRVFTLFALLISAAFLNQTIAQTSASAQKSNDEAFAKMQTAHAAALRTWLAAKPHLRPATEADCTNKDGLKLQRSGDANYQPYYFTGDFNGDRQTDFAVALVDSKKAKDKGFALVIFNGGKSGFRQAHFQSNLDLRRSGLFFFGEKPERLAVGEFQTDDCGYFKWSGGKYVAENCASGEN